MSAAAASNTDATTVYVRLLDEGTDVFRPSLAVALGEDTYELLRSESYDPEDECWEFEPGFRVRVVRRQGATGEFLLAASLAE